MASSDTDIERVLNIYRILSSKTILPSVCCLCMGSSIFVFCPDFNCVKRVIVPFVQCVYILGKFNTEVCYIMDLSAEPHIYLN